MNNVETNEKNKRKKKKNNQKSNNKKNNKNNIKIEEKIDYRKERNKKKKKKVWKKILIMILSLILITLAVAIGMFIYRTQKNGGGVSGMLQAAVGHDEFTKKDLPEFRCLMLGISTDQEDVDLTDTIIVASYNPNTQKATLLSIPRDTYTGKNPSRATAYDKINAVYSRRHSAEDTLKVVNEITGLDIPYYVVVRTEALIKLVDEIGGVNFDVPIRMKYTDTSQDLYIDLQKGMQKLDGDKAEQLLRFRKNDNGTTYPEEYGGNDTGRMKTQRNFIIQAVKQTVRLENIFKLGGILDIAKEYIETNIDDFNYIKDYLPYAVEFKTENVLSAVLPGTNTNENRAGTWIFVHDKKKTKEMVEELFYERDEEVEEEISEESQGEEKIGKDFKIEVLNGSGNSNSIQKLVEELKSMGYNITKTGVTNSMLKTTIINKGNVSKDSVEDVQDIVGVGTIERSKEKSEKIDLTIIIGKDYK